MIPASKLMKMLFFFSFFDKPSNCKRLVTNNKQYNNEEIKTIQFLFLYFISFFFLGLYGLEP